MSTEAALLAAVIASPDDDLPRLVFADWCDENGQPEHAEFIRRQIERHRLGDKAGPLYASDPIVRLHHEHKAAWLADFPKAFHIDPPSWHFRRGFLEQLRLSAAKFIRIPKRAWARHPLEGLWLDDVHGRLDRVLARPEMARIRRLTFFARDAGEELTDSDLEALATTPHLSEMRELSLWTRNGNAFPEALARCPSLRALERLNLADTLMDANGVAALTRDRAENVRMLKRLRIEPRQAGPEIAMTVAASPALAGLEELTFWGADSGDAGRIGDAGAAALGGSPHHARLHFLFLHCQAVGPAGARALAASPHFANLRTLRLDQTRLLGADGVRAVVSGRWSGLTHLDLTLCRFGNDGAVAMAEGGTLTGLTHLDLTRNNIGPAGAVALSRAKWLGGLRKLELDANPIGDEGAVALAESEILAGLQELRLGSRGDCKVSADAAKLLVARFGKDVIR